jgi:hypothetical protein
MPLDHRRDAEDAERSLFSLAVERTASEKNFSPSGKSKIAR